MPSVSTSIILLFIFLLGLFCLTAMNTAFRRLHRRDSKKQLDAVGQLFFFRSIILRFFPKNEYEDLHFSNIFTQNVVRFCYAIVSITLIVRLNALLLLDSQNPLIINSVNFDGFEVFIQLTLLFILLFIIGDYLARVFGNRMPNLAISFCAPLVSILMTLLFPFIFLFLKILHYFPTAYIDPSHEPNEEAKHEIIKMFQDFSVDFETDPHEKQLIESVMKFKDRIAREVMVPRVSIFSLESHLSIHEAARLLLEEGYSRTPVYHDKLDNIIGVLMYKDILAKYMEYAEKKDEAILKQPISGLVKNIIYTPETKKIAQLLQEFKKKQVHLAIIVDEYGGTEGIVTIEDILEEIVGDIADEYDEAESLFLILAEGGWLIDARMSISDIEEQLGIDIPQNGDYDTIGGYVFHETGMIPPKGYTIVQPTFKIEVVRSNNRQVEKLRIETLNNETEPFDSK